MANLKPSPFKLTDIFREDGFLYDEKFNYSARRYDLLDYLEIETMNATLGVGKMVLKPEFGGGYWYPLSQSIFTLIGGQFTFSGKSQVTMLDGKGTFCWRGPETFGEYYGQKEPVPVIVEEIGLNFAPIAMFSDGDVVYIYENKAVGDITSLWKYEDGRLSVVKRNITEHPEVITQRKHPGGFYNDVAFFVSDSSDNVFSMPNLQTGDTTPVAVMDESAGQAFGNLYEATDGLYVFDYYDEARYQPNVWKITNASSANYLGVVDSGEVEQPRHWFHPYLKRIYLRHTVWGYCTLAETMPYSALADANIGDIDNTGTGYVVNERDDKIYFQRLVAAPSAVKGVTVYDPVTNVASNLTGQATLDTNEVGFLDETPILIWNDQLLGLNDDEILRFLQPRGSKLNMAPSVCFARKRAPGIEADDFWQETQMFKTKVVYLPYSNAFKDFEHSFGIGELGPSAYEADNGRHIGFRVESDNSIPKVYATFKNDSYTFKQVVSTVINSNTKYKFEIQYYPDQQRVAWYIDDEIVASLDGYVISGTATDAEMMMYTHGLRVWGNMDGVEIHEVKYYIDS